MKHLEKFKPLDQDLFQEMADHEQVMFCNDPYSGLQAIIAIHDTTLGPALGGTRMYPYRNVNEALEDVLRLSEGMTYKCAASDVDFGGGKGVIIGDPEADKSEALFRSYGQFVDSLNGRFYTGTDMGTTMEDFVLAAKETNFINGIPEAFGGSGDSSIPTSEGVLYGLRATNHYLFGSEDLGGRTYAIQGLGKVGFKVAERLIHEGADIYVSDINDETVAAITNKATDENVVTPVDADDIYRTDADILVPCAMGGVINGQTIPQLQVKAIVGSANNQLAEENYARVLKENGILFAPDYMVNSGGLMQVSDELYEFNRERVLLKTKNIYDSLLAIYHKAETDSMTTLEAAQQKSRTKIHEQYHLNNFFSRKRRPKWDIKE